MKTILCFGNPYLKEDSLAVELAKELKLEGYEFRVCYSAEEILEHRDVLIMDVVKGLREVKIIEKLEELNWENSVSLHDMDLAFYMKLMNALGSMGKVRIIGLPFGRDKEYVKEQLEKLLEKDL
ncbi:MAG: hypothetical protein ABIG95_03565 [Candidatus Woesearchaeota archaeon]